MNQRRVKCIMGKDKTENTHGCDVVPVILWQLVQSSSLIPHCGFAFLVFPCFPQFWSPIQFGRYPVGLVSLKLKRRLSEHPYCFWLPFTLGDRFRENRPWCLSAPII